MQDPPSIPGYELHALIGQGATGSVYRASIQGSDCAVKVFDSLAINRQYLSYSLSKLFALDPHPNLIRMVGGDLSNRPYYVATALEEQSLSGWDAPGEGEDPAPTWAVIHQVAEGLAFLHRNGIVHCNLTLENIRLAGGGGGGVHPVPLLSDFATGLVAGVHHLELSHHPYYLSPEQLRDPERLASGGRVEAWDVYSFGVVAFRLLTGGFPRGETTVRDFIRMARGATQAGARPKPDDFAALIEAEPEPVWPGKPAGTELERGMREIVLRCLSLDASDRFADMREVIAAFDDLERGEAMAEVESRAASQVKKADRKTRGAKAVAKLLGVLALAGAGASLSLWDRWQRAEVVIEQQAGEFEVRSAALDGQLAQLAQEAERAVVARDLALAERGTARHFADELFRLVVAEPPAPGAVGEERRGRALADAAALYSRFLDAGSTVPGATSAVERMRAEHSLALVYREQERVDEALAMFSEAAGHLAAWLAENPDDPVRHDMEIRLAECLAATVELHVEGREMAEAAAAAGEVEQRFGAEVEQGIVGERVKAAVARAYFARGIALADSGKPAAAEAAFGDCRRVLAVSVIESGPAGITPPSQELLAVGARAQVETGRCQIETDRTKEAAKTLVDAVESLLALGAQYPDDTELRFLLARAYGDLGEVVSALGGAADSSRAHTEAVKILSELVKTEPGVARYRLELARQYGAVSDLVRDAGQTDKAREYVDGAIAFLVDLFERDPADIDIALTLAREEGRKAELLLDGGERDPAIDLLGGAVSRAEAFGSTVPTEGRRLRRYHQLLAGLYGQLGHANESAERTDSAIDAFAKAVDHWKQIASAGGGSGTNAIEAGLAWSQERLRKLQPDADPG